MTPGGDYCTGSLRGPKQALCTHSQKPLLTVKRALEAARIAPVGESVLMGEMETKWGVRGHESQ